MAKILYQQEKKEFIPELNKDVTIVKARTYFISNTDQDYHTEKGVIDKSQFKGTGAIKSNTDRTYQLIDADFSDLYKRIKRLAQIIPRKDVGMIIAELGIGKESVIVDSGAGSGGLSLFLAHIAKKVTTYDIKQEHVDIVNQNIEYLKLTNIKAKLGNVYKTIPGKDIDVLTLDVPEPWKALPTASKILKLGGFICSYSPCIPQVADFVNTVSELPEFVHVKTVEIMEREWEVTKRKVRPKSKMMGHSGFLTFVRKIA